MTVSTDHFTEEDNLELLANEFNTLYTVYRCKAEYFIEEGNVVKFEKMPPDHSLPREAAVAPVTDPGVCWNSS